LGFETFSLIVSAGAESSGGDSKAEKSFPSRLLMICRIIFYLAIRKSDITTYKVSSSLRYKSAEKKTLCKEHTY
jgi:hypothetical protein